MDPAREPAMEVLDLDECWQLLDSVSVGRLAVDIAGQPDIFPINFVVHDGGILFRSAPGTKLAGAVLNRHVAFEIDGYEPEQRIAWSVVVKGIAHEIERMQDVFEAEEQPLFPWIAFPKPDFVRIEPALVTGRRFHVVEDVVVDDSLGWHGLHRAEGSDNAVLPEPGAEYHPGEPRMRPG
jgi:nitroimidazol reductase NimA-like FMN-containing flavoprotein (pyridoxamine 5'-phosphate oxidase superfamily)